MKTKFKRSKCCNLFNCLIKRTWFQDALDKVRVKMTVEGNRAMTRHCQIIMCFVESSPLHLLIWLQHVRFLTCFEKGHHCSKISSKQIKANSPVIIHCFKKRQQNNLTFFKGQSSSPPPMHFKLSNRNVARTKCTYLIAWHRIVMSRFQHVGHRIWRSFIPPETLAVVFVTGSLLFS